MSTFRLIYHSLWSDEKVIECFTPCEKLMWIFLLTHKNTTQIGIYKLNLAETCFYTGLSRETVMVMLDRFENEYKIIRYNKDTKEICIIRWSRYNVNRLGGKPAMDCLRSELKKVEDKSLINIALEYITKTEIRKIFSDAIGDDCDVVEGIGIDDGDREAKGKDGELYEKPTEDQLRRAKEM